MTWLDLILLLHGHSTTRFFWGGPAWNRTHTKGCLRSLKQAVNILWKQATIVQQLALKEQLFHQNIVFSYLFPKGKILSCEVTGGGGDRPIPQPLPLLWPWITFCWHGTWIVIDSTCHWTQHLWNNLLQESFVLEQGPWWRFVIFKKLLIYCWEKCHLFEL